jgi:glycine hydroxymethyltransferase
VTGGTSNHLLLVDVGFGRGVFLQEALERVGISLNKNTIPNEPASPFYPSGIRMGTPSMTMRGMKEEDMKRVADFIIKVNDEIRDFTFEDARKKEILVEFREFIRENQVLSSIHDEVKALCKKFPIYEV